MTLDLTTVHQALQAFSGEVVTDKLLAKMMTVLTENAGAETGYLLLKKQEAWTITASGTTQRDGILVTIGELETHNTGFPQEMIQYVARTQETIVLGDAVHEGAFTQAPYVVAHQPKSILCIPIQSQSKLIGILYLENNAIAQAFTPERLSLLSLLCSQAAISLENARLYEQLEDYSRTLELKVEERTQALQQEIRVSEAFRRNHQLLEEKLHTSESKMRAVFEAMTDIVMIFDTEGSIEVMPTHPISLSAPHFDLISHIVEKFFQDESSGQWLHQIQQTLDTQQTVNFDYSFPIGEQHFSFAVCISRMSHNSFIWVARDISDRIQTELALQLSEEKFSKAFRSSPIAITITSLADGRHLEVNDTFCQMTGYTHQEIIGHNAMELELWVNSEDRDRLFQILKLNGVVCNYEFEFRTKLGEIRTALLSAEIINIHGENCLLSLSNDITKRNQAETALRQKNQELAQTLQELKLTQKELIQSEKMAALGQLIAGIAHEINTPLGAIRASISNIANALERSIWQLPQLFQQLSTERQTDFFALLEAAQENKGTVSFREERQFKRALRQELETYKIDDAKSIAATLAKIGLIQDIPRFLPLLRDQNNTLILDTVYNLLVQKNNSNNIILAVERASKIVFALKNYTHHDDSERMTQASVAEGIDLVLTIYQNQLKQGIEVKKKYTDLPAILCYPEELNQVWTNLIHNAIQAMNYKGELEINVFESTQHVVVTITDSGTGISPEIKARIFEPFFTTKSAGEGSGLGLHIVRNIIDKHQGKIEVESKPGHTTFSVWLPMRVDG